MDAIENQIIKYIAEDNNVIIDEYDLYTLITVISSILDYQNLLIFSENSIIGQIFENFADTPAKIGLYTKNITCNTSNSKITDVTLYDTIDMKLYDIIIMVINDQVPEVIIHEIAQICSQINKQVIVYRLFPSHCYADQIFIDEFGEKSKYLIGTKRRTSNFILNNNTEINFDDCIGMFFHTIEEAHQIIKISALKQGFEIKLCDGLTSKQTSQQTSKQTSQQISQQRRVWIQCKSSKRSSDDKEASYPFSIYLKYCKKENKYYIKQCNAPYNHPISIQSTQWQLLSAKQIRLVLSLKRNKVPIIEINKILNDIYGLNINLTNNQIRKLKKNGHMNVDSLETTELENVKIKKDHDDKGNIIRTAILCIDKDELDNLLSDKGNPIFIDGTSVPNRLHWELTLITLVDQNLNIQPGGLMFSLNSTKDAFDWFMKKLMKILKEHKKT